MKVHFWQFKNGSFATQNNGFYNTLDIKQLHNRYACEKYLQLYCLLFAYSIRFTRAHNVPLFQ
ncbi:hypothetical protein BWX39_01450 [Prevotella intermedia ATCC 25611 = DSM 20706]|nr:hypothetical protein BWX39_01450 [Prevotella intermedia ATCC 25611 = DSM 20706]